MIGYLPDDKKFLRAVNGSKQDIRNEWKEGRLKRIRRESSKSNLATLLEQQTRILASLVPDEILEKVDNYKIRHYDAVFLYGDVSVICAPDLKAVGGIVIDTQLVGPTQRDFLIFVSSQLSYQGHNGGSHITSCVSANLHTIEEKRVEFINLGVNLVNEKHLYTALQNTGYYMASHSRLETTLSNYWYPFDKTQNLILEGANFILMRYLAFTKYIGDFEMVTLYINGDLCRNIYICDGPLSVVVNNTKCDVVRIQRIIVEKCGIEHNCIVTLLLTGQIVKQEWHNCSYVLHLNPLIDMEKDSPSQYTKFPTFYEWEKDLQLFSKYLDFKTKRLAIYKNYYEDHPDLKDLIADYSQNLLLCKPEDVLDFTLKYFRRFSKDQLPYSFTELSVLYNVAGKGGPSKLTQMLNSYMGAMIQEVLSHHGDVLKFSGDAFFCMWKTDRKYSLKEIVHDAIDCAIFIQRRCGSYLTDVGVTLRVKIAIAAGPVIFSIIGNEHLSHYVVAGTPITDVKEAQSRTDSGEILISQSAWNLTNEFEYLIADMHDGKHYKVAGFSSKWKSSARRRHQQEVIPSHEDKIFTFYLNNRESSKGSDSTSSSNGTEQLPFSLSQFYNDENEGFTLRPLVDKAIKNNLREKLRRFVIPPVMRGIELNEPLEFLTEVRHVVILILNIIIEETILEKFVNLINDSFEIISRIVDEMKGCVNKISLFDKDYMVLCIFGLRGMKSYMESQIALQCGHDIRQNLIGIPEIQTVSCAVTTGLTYCGVVGHALRREYTVISITVNKAARLMIAYPNKVTCDRDTFLQSKLDAKYFILQKYVKLKGISKVEPVYEYREHCENKKNRVNQFPILDRDLEMDLYKELLNNFITKKAFKEENSLATANTTIGLIIQGGPKQGKTTLVYEMINVTPSDIPVHNFYLQHKDHKEPYTTIRIIFGLPVGLKYAEVGHDEREMTLIRHLSKVKETELYCALNEIFEVRFEYSDMYKKITQHERHAIKRKLFEHLVQSYFPSLWILVIDHAEFIDDKSWILLNYLFKLERCFTILTIGQKPLSENGKEVIERLKMKQIILRPLSKWYHAALACQMLNVRAIPVELERMIQIRSNGNPGWIQNYLITLNQMKVISIQNARPEDISELGLVIPPSETLIRQSSLTLQPKESTSAQSNNVKRDDIWKLLEQCIVDSETVLPRTFIAEQSAEVSPNLRICRLASHFKVDEFNSEYNSMNALIMKTFDSLSSYEQHLVKCSSILGERFLRTMLSYVMLIQASPFRTASAVKNLFDIKVLTCARGYFDEYLSLILESNTCDDLNEGNGELCQCQGLKYDETCKDLPKYAECGYMKFESHIFQETIYSLLTDHQKKEVHGRAIRYLEKNTRRCKFCGRGVFHRFDGISRYQVDHWNRNQMMFHADELIQATENLSVHSSNVTTNHSFEGIKSSFLILDPISFETISISSTLQAVKFYNVIKKDKNRSKNNKLNNDKLNVLSQIPKFSDKNLAKCQCNSILNWTFTQFIIHLRGAGRYDKLLQCKLDYAHFCIHNSNIPLAFKLLDDAKTLLETQTIYDEDNAFATWLIPIHNGRIHMLIGGAKLQLKEYNAALKSLDTALSYFGRPFPKTKIGLKYAIKKQHYRQKLFLRFPQKFIHKKTGMYGEFCEILSDCLGYLYELYKEMSAWNLARLAGTWCLNEALRARLSFRAMCKAYAIMIEICTYFDMSSDLLEVLAIKLCAKRQYVIETSEFQSVMILYQSILANRFVKGKMYEAKEIGYIILHLARKLHDVRTIKETIQHLIDTLFFLNKFTEILYYINEMYFHSVDYCDVTQRVAYFADCIHFTLNTGYAIIDMSRCEYHRKLEYGSVDQIFSTDSEKRFFVNMWLWYVRHSNWNGAKLYYPQEITNRFDQPKRCSLLDQWLTLQFLEGLIITLVYNADIHYIERVTELKHQIENIIKQMDFISREKSFLKSRYYHLKAYYLKVNYANPKVEKLLQAAKDNASKFNDFYDHGFVSHNELYWEGKLAPELVDLWKISSSSVRDWRVLLEDSSKIIYYTFVLPCKPICS